MIARGLIGWWRAEGSGQDASGNGLHLTAGSAVTYAGGRLGRAWSLTHGTDSGMSRANVTPPVNLTFTAWVKANTADEIGYVFSFGHPPSERRANLAWMGSSNQLAIVDAGSLRYSLAVFGGTDWTYIGVTIEGRNVTFYKAGVAAGTVQYAGDPLTSAEIFYVGRRSGNYTDGAWFSGLVDEAMLWNRILAPREMRAVMATGWPGAAI